ncbi:hypothetical protein BIV23_42380 [Streptomyces monashensis]|uniref:Uncharacterized protein n=1 Tax=Streptomyces monashensis TaxID=1678012 RepID=A0A1S2P2P0_9ACTN|nr:hypothetical protein BIV23_42380 [Streptomyces monashensis]
MRAVRQEQSRTAGVEWFAVPGRQPREELQRELFVPAHHQHCSSVQDSEAGSGSTDRNHHGAGLAEPTSSLLLRAVHLASWLTCH